MTERLPFERWARISASLCVTKADLREVHLERWGFTNDEWTAEEVAWSTVLADDLAAGRTERALAYGRMCAAVRQALEAAAEPPEPSEPRVAEPAGGNDDGDVTHFGSAVPNEPTLPFMRLGLGVRGSATAEGGAAPPPAALPAAPARDRGAPPELRTEVLPAQPHGEPTLPFKPKRRGS